MPFVSAAQRRACYARNDPNWDCEAWDLYGGGKIEPAAEFYESEDEYLEAAEIAVEDPQPEERLCFGKVCCQALTLDGNQCKRPASLRYYVKSLKIPFLGEYELNCCNLCTQHALVYATPTLIDLLKWYSNRGLSYEEWCVANWVECEQYKKKLTELPVEFY